LSKIFGTSGVRQSLPGKIVKWAMSRALRKHNHRRLEVLSSFDNPLRYQRDQISRFRDFVEARLADRIEKKCRAQSGIDVLLIERGDPNQHYADVGRTSGSQRRSVPNIDVLRDLLKARHRTELLNLEDTDLASQIAVFRNARAVVAQHGAALTNIIWMRPGSLVIEIIPPRKVPEAADKEYFSRLAAEMAVRHHYVFQEHDHAELTQSQMHQIQALLAQEDSH
ncbi:MAG: glycosyltransferase family 61 protein, partial [Pseudomonadota bacterium]